MTRHKLKYYERLRRFVASYERGIYTPLELAHLCAETEMSHGHPADYKRWLWFSLRMASRRAQLHQRLSERARYHAKKDPYEHDSVHGKSANV